MALPFWVHQSQPKRLSVPLVVDAPTMLPAVEQ
jgi:hypothetical protein